MKATHKSEDDEAGHIITYKQDGTTEAFRQDAETDSDLTPIKVIGKAT